MPTSPLGRRVEVSSPKSAGREKNGETLTCLPSVPVSTSAQTEGPSGASLSGTVMDAIPAGETVAPSGLVSTVAYTGAAVHGVPGGGGGAFSSFHDTTPAPLPISEARSRPPLGSPTTMETR